LLHEAFFSAADVAVLHFFGKKELQTHAFSGWVFMTICKAFATHFWVVTQTSTSNKQ